MTRFRAACLVFVLPALAVAEDRLSRPETPPRRPPNIVFFLADDMGWRDAGCYGSTFHETPNIDRLAKEGMRFTDAYAACPVCSPTRASIMTGKYPARLGTTDYFGGPQPDAVQWHWTRNKPLLPAPYLDHLPLEETTIAKALRQGGYRTYFAGKWHLGGKGYWPEEQGFEINIGGWTGGMPASYFSPYKNPKLPRRPPGRTPRRPPGGRVGQVPGTGRQQALLSLSCVLFGPYSPSGKAGLDRQVRGEVEERQELGTVVPA